MTRCLRSVLILLTLTAAAKADPPVRVHTVEQLRAAARSAGPGTAILLEPGVYRGPIWLEKLHGSPESPITIRSVSADHPAIIEGGAECMHLVDPRHVVIEDLILRRGKNNALNIDDGGTMLGTASVTLRNLTVRDVLGKGNADGVKLSGLHDFLVENCLIADWGVEGQGMDLVGCRDGKIVGCTIRHRDLRAGVGLQLKGGTRDVVVERCTFDEPGLRGINVGGDTGLQFFRPQPPPHHEAANITVQRCTFIGAEAPIAFVGVDGATVRRNLFYHPRKWLFRILQEQRAPGFVTCRGGVLEQNLVVFRSQDVKWGMANIGDATSPETFRFDRNFWFCDDAPAKSKPQLPAAETGGVYGQDPKLTRTDTAFKLQPGSPAAAFGPFSP